MARKSRHQQAVSTSSVENISVLPPAEGNPETPIATVVESSASRINALPGRLNQSLTGLARGDYTLLLRKQRWLQNNSVTTPKDAAGVASAVNATLVFAQEEAGTAVCISPHGYLLTCAHCIAETAEELDKSKTHWLLFASGVAAEAKCVAWDPQRDLALLEIIAAQKPSPNAVFFPHILPATHPPDRKQPITCIGHPGSEDLQAEVPGIKTNFDVLHVSCGSFRGYAAGQDLQDNSEIGALKHDCWTYWGHSGAPIVEPGTGSLVGLHSSWDTKTGMRRGVPLEAISEFLKLNSGLSNG